MWCWDSSIDDDCFSGLCRVDLDTLLYEFAVDDADTFTDVFSGAIPLNRLDEPLYEYACHEGNYGLMNMMRGARETYSSLTDTSGGQ